MYKYLPITDVYASLKHWNYGIKKNGTEGLAYNRQQIMLMQGLPQK